MKTSRLVPSNKLVRVCSLLPMLFLCSAVVHAANINVDCGAGESINAALVSLDPVGPHTITVVGTCTENISIDLHDRITIQAPNGQTATIQAANANNTVVLISSSRRIVLNRLIIRGGRNGVSINLGSDVNIHNSNIKENSAVGVLLTQSTLNLDSSTIENNSLTGLGAQGSSVANVGGATLAQRVVITGNGTGVSVLESSVQLIGNYTVENNANFGFDVAGGRLNLVGNQPGQGNLIHSNGGGINVRNGASCIVFGQTAIQNNGSNGIIVSNGSNLTINETVLPNATILTTVIEGHSTAGLTVAQQGQVTLAGRHKISNNGASAATCASTVCGGIRVFSGSQLTLRGGTEVTANTGPGVVVEHHGTLLVTIPVVITGNTEDGIRQFIQSATSILPSTPAPAPGVNNISSVICDNTSVIGGDLNGIARVSCKIAKF